jgi:hypothetical protein
MLTNFDIKHKIFDMQLINLVGQWLTSKSFASFSAQFLYLKEFL